MRTAEPLIAQERAARLLPMWETSVETFQVRTGRTASEAYTLFDDALERD